MSESRPALIRIRGQQDGNMVVEVCDKDGDVLASPYIFCALKPGEIQPVAEFDESFTLKRVLL